MDCPECRSESQVIDSRPSSRFVKRRRRSCVACGHRFSTYEIVEELVNQQVQIVLTMKMDGGRLASSTTARSLCACGNAARYVVLGESAPRYCGVCDITQNDGRGERA